MLKIEVDPTEAIEVLEPLVPAQRRMRQASVGASLPPQLEDQDLLALGETIDNLDFEWPEWNRLGMAFFAASGGSDAGFTAFDSSRSEAPSTTPTRHRIAGSTIAAARPTGLAPAR